MTEQNQSNTRNTQQQPQQRDRSQSGPVHQYRIGNVQSSIFENQTQNGRSYYTASIERRWQDEQKNWHSSTSFGHADLLNLSQIAERSEQYIAQQQHRQQQEAQQQRDEAEKREFMEELNKDQSQDQGMSQ